MKRFALSWIDNGCGRLWLVRRGYVTEVLDRIDEIFGGFQPVSLDALDERASLQRRVDIKYLVPLDRLAQVSDALRGDYEILEIDGQRVFEYESTYFDTSALDSFHDHIASRRPRYKLRTRYYVTNESCMFEVKVKRDDDETVKRHIDYEPDDRRKIKPSARELFSETFEECSVKRPEGDPRPSLVTRFRRVTVAAINQPERITVDFGVELQSPDGDTAAMDESLAIIETKTPDGSGPVDRMLRDEGLDPLSLSKYRLGIGLLVAPEADREYSRRLQGAVAVSR
jgi:hypothetical protein